MAWERWEIDSGHSGLLFSVRHMTVVRIRGRFTRWSGTILVESGNPLHLSVDVFVDASSVETGVLDRDAHLKSADFLDVARFPDITFRGTRTGNVHGRRLRLLGELAIRGVVREVALRVEHTGRARDPWGHDRAGFTASASIDRRAFGLQWNQLLEAGGVLVGNLVDIEIEVEAVRQEEAREHPAAGIDTGDAPERAGVLAIHPSRTSTTVRRSPR